MNLAVRLLGALGMRLVAPAGCRGCTHFCQDGARLEVALPGLAVLSSAAGSTRADDGFCRHHDALINGQARCADYKLSPAPCGASVLSRN
jgi:hypothetical protein